MKKKLGYCHRGAERMQQKIFQRKHYCNTALTEVENFRGTETALLFSGGKRLGAVSNDTMSAYLFLWSSVLQHILIEL